MIWKIHVIPVKVNNLTYTAKWVWLDLFCSFISTLGVDAIFIDVTTKKNILQTHMIVMGAIKVTINATFSLRKQITLPYPVSPVVKMLTITLNSTRIIGNP